MKCKHLVLKNTFLFQLRWIQVGHHVGLKQQDKSGGTKKTLTKSICFCVHAYTLYKALLLLQGPLYLNYFLPFQLNF